MKEIDFLPTWYKNGRQRQISYRAQYAGIGCIFVAMIIWNFIAAHSLSEAEASLGEAKMKLADVESSAQEYATIKSEAARLKEKVITIGKIDSKIDVASVLAEISFLTNRKIVLSKVEFSAEKFGSKQAEKPNSDYALRAVSSFNKALPYKGDIRFKVLLSGVAPEAGDVAAFICELEDSPYFCRVIPLFTRNKEIMISTKGRGEKLQVSEFEISCDLANYQQDESYSVSTGKLKQSK